jgi:hypothetical protein
MPADQIHERDNELTKVVLNYDPKTGALTDPTGKLIVTWDRLHSFPASPKPSIPLPVRQSPLGDIIRLKEAGFNALEIISLKNSNTY